MRARQIEKREPVRRERAPGPEPPAPRGLIPGPLQALQRTAGNQAVGRLLQRTVVVGLPGPNNPKTTYDGAHAGNLVAALNVIAGMPPWINAWLQPHLTAIEASPASYELDNVDDIAWWIVIRELAGDLLAYLQQPRVLANRGDTGDNLRRAYAAIEAQRAIYAAQGAIGGQYQLFGLTYQLTNQGPNHFYAARPAGTNIEYHGLRRDRAKALVNHLLASGAGAAGAAYTGEAKEVDDFVCAFLAEPTRWPEDQVFNVLTLTRAGTQPLTGSESANSLPMAGGTTWDANLSQLGRQLPKRAISHATAEGLMAIIAQELPAAAGWPAFLTAMHGQLGFN
jgi:hypothetical protein